ncbi:MAG: M28 family peptidase, partial [Thermoleophilia bacterium]|nr:M28 family peptidase [Thermoleophilia bacterium]
MPGAPRASRPRRRRRPRSADRPVNARLYRIALAGAAVAALAVSFAIAHPDPLPVGPPPAFDATAALDAAAAIARQFPDRAPGTPGAARAADFVARELALSGYSVERDRFTASIAGRGDAPLENLVATARGRSARTIVVVAHRDDVGVGPGADVNASGTAALLELARIYGPATEGGGGAVVPTHTIVFLSTDGGAFGGLGAQRFARAARPRRIVAAVNLVAVAGRKRARLEIAGETARSPASTLVLTAAARIREQTGEAPRRTGVLGQLIDLAFPLSFYDHAPFVAHDVPAVTITTASARPPEPFGDGPERLSAGRLAELGASAQALVESLDQGLELAAGPASYLYLGSRIAAGWAIQLALLAVLAAFLLVLADLVLRAARRGVAFVPALRSFARRLGFWLAAAGAFWLFGAAGAWADGPDRPISPHTDAAGDWAVRAVGLYCVLLLAGWLIARTRLLPERDAAPEDELGGYAVALLGVAVLGIATVVANPYALLFVLPSAHAWLWLPQLRESSSWLRVGVFALGLAGPLVLLGSLAIRF